MKEGNIQRLIQIRAATMGCTLFRNNIGKFQDKTGRWVAFGVGGAGGSDLLGIYKGRFVALEVKKTGEKPRPEQQNFIDFVNKNGGIAAVLYSPDDLDKYLL